MSELHFSNGEGKLSHSGSTIIFSLGPNEELFAMGQQQQPSINFKALATLVVNHSFELPPFVVVDTELRNIFVSGAIVATVDGVALDGSTTTTWIESRLEPEASITCGAMAEVSGLLNDGWARADGFSIGPVQDAPVSQVRGVETADSDHALERSATVTDSEPLEEVFDLTETTPVPSGDPAELAEVTSLPEPPVVSEPVSSPPLSDLEAVPTQPLGGSLQSTTETLAEPSVPEPLDEALPDSAALDPLADPEISLESIGAPEAVTDLTSPPLAPPALDLLPTEPKPQPELEPETATDEDEPTSPRSLIPPPPSGTPTLQLTDEHAESTIGRPPSSGQSRHTLRFDDGQQITVETGLYVGRHPTKKGLPDGYGSITISGDQVSRVHWELVPDTGGATVRDLGSNSGTQVEEGGQQVDVPEGGMHISSGAKVHFADRSAVYELT